MSVETTEHDYEKVTNTTVTVFFSESGNYELRCNYSYSFYFHGRLLE